MATVASSPFTPAVPGASAVHDKFAKGPGLIGTLIFAVVAVGAVGYIGWNLTRDLSELRSGSALPYLLLGVALLVALGFEFVNRFHDTANAVATVIYTHSLDPHIAVTGAVAFGIVSLLPVELILQVGSSAGFAMIFALLVAAILWNLGTWYFGLPASSSHTLIGSIIGVGIANQLMAARTGTSGVDWAQAANIGKSLLISPIVGFVCASMLLLFMKAVIKEKRLYAAPEGTQPPPFWIRGLLVLTCTGVSFFHGSNDGQKGMGLIMLILIGTVPTTYALNHAVTPRQTARTLSPCRNKPPKPSTSMWMPAPLSAIPVTTTSRSSSAPRNSSPIPCSPCVRSSTLSVLKWPSSGTSPEFPTNRSATSATICT
jgi:inorganic phosphate transporter, PiT family